MFFIIRTCFLRTPFIYQLVSPVTRLHLLMILPSLKSFLAMMNFKDFPTICFLFRTSLYKPVRMLTHLRCFECLFFFAHSVRPSEPTFISSEMLTRVDFMQYLRIVIDKSGIFTFSFVVKDLRGLTFQIRGFRHYRVKQGTTYRFAN